MIQEVHSDPEAPSCHVCGAQLVANGYKCLSCKATTNPTEPEAGRWIPVSALKDFLSDTWCGLDDQAYDRIRKFIETYRPLPSPPDVAAEEEK